MMNSQKSKHTPAYASLLLALLLLFSFPGRIALAAEANAIATDIAPLVAALMEGHGPEEWTGDAWAAALLGNPRYRIPTEAHIPQEEALARALTLLIALGYESIDTLTAALDEMDGSYASFLFQVDNHENPEWEVYIGLPANGRSDGYTIAIGASTGIISAFSAYAASPLTHPHIIPMPTAFAEPIQTLIAQWKTALSGTPRWDLHGDFPYLPGESTIPREEALAHAITAACLIRGIQPADLSGYEMGLGFSDQNEWVITLWQEDDTGGTRRIYAYVEGDTGMVTGLMAAYAPAVTDPWLLSDEPKG